MAKAWLDQMGGFLGAVAACISIGTAIASVSFTTISTALFWAAIGFIVIVAFAILIGFLIMARDPEIPTAQAVKAGLGGFFTVLVGAGYIFSFGYEDRSEFGVTQVIGGVVLITSAVAFALWYYSRWKTKHKKCPNCDKVNVVQAIKCKECGRQFRHPSSVSR